MKSRKSYFQVNINWYLLNLITEIDRFDATWKLVVSKEEGNLDLLKSLADMRSVTAAMNLTSPQITDEQVAVLLKNPAKSDMKDVGQQEVLSYFNTLQLVYNGYQEFDITDTDIKRLHSSLFQHKVANQFSQYTEEGATSMQKLLEWYKADLTPHPLVRCAIFMFELLSARPFEEDNTKLGILLTRLLLLRNGYEWTRYVSLEEEIINRRSEFFRMFRICESYSMENLGTEWVLFFMDLIKEIKDRLKGELRKNGMTAQFSDRERDILTFIANKPNAQSGNIGSALNIPLPTVKRMLTRLTEIGILEKSGTGRGTKYSIK